MTIYNPRADFKDEFGWLKLEQIHEQVKDLTAHAFHSQWKLPSSVGQRAPTKRVKTAIRRRFDFFFPEKKKYTIVLLILKDFLQSSFFIVFLLLLLLLHL